MNMIEKANIGSKSEIRRIAGRIMKLAVWPQLQAIIESILALGGPPYAFCNLLIDGGSLLI
jgi:hypothetical protein